MKTIPEVLTEAAERRLCGTSPGMYTATLDASENTAQFNAAVKVFENLSNRRPMTPEHGCMLLLLAAEIDKP